MPGSTCKIMFRRADAEDAEEVYRLMMEVYEEMIHKEYFVPEKREDIVSYTKDQGMVFVAYDEKERLAGYFIVAFPKESENLASEIGLSPEEQKKAVHMESCCVRKEYRGHGIQKEFFQIVEQCIDRKKYRYLLGTVAPGNISSLRNFQECGYHCVMTKEKYGGLLRHIMMKVLGAGSLF